MRRRRGLAMRAREMASICCSPPLGEDGKELEDVFHVPSYPLLVPPQKGPHVEVLLDRQVGEDPPPLRDLGDPDGHDLVGLAAPEGLPPEEDLAAARGDDAADGHEGRGFPRPVGADEGDDLPLPHG